MPVSGILSDLQSELEGGLQQIAVVTGVPGIAVSASIRGASLSAQVGHACLERGTKLSEASRFEMSCLMKFLISSFTMQEVARGSIGLDAAIESHLPELQISTISERPITIANLASHSSGLRGLDISQGRTKWAFSWEQLVQHIRGSRPSFPPGCVFNYEHSEHILLAEVLKRHFRTEVEELLTAEIFGPLDIERSTPATDRKSDSRYVGQHAFAASVGRYVPSPMPAFGSFWKYSLPDATLTLTEIRRAAEWVMRNAARSGLADVLTRPVVDIPAQVRSSATAEDIPKSFGHICGQYGSGVIGHNGSSFGQTIGLRMDVVKDISVAVGINAWAPATRDLAAHFVLRLLRGAPSGKCAGHDSQPIRFQISDLIGSFGLKDLVGTYVGSYGTQVVVSERDKNVTLLVGAARSEPHRISINRMQNGEYEMASRRPVSCAFEPHPVDATPVCFLGVHSYRKLCV